MSIPGELAGDLDEFRKHCRFRPLPHDRCTRVVRVLSSIPEIYLMIIEQVELDLNVFTDAAQRSSQSSPQACRPAPRPIYEAHADSDTTSERSGAAKESRNGCNEPIRSCHPGSGKWIRPEAGARHQVRYSANAPSQEHQHAIPVSFDALSYTWDSPFIEHGRQDSYSSAHDVAVTLITWPKLVHRILIRRNLYEALCAVWNCGRDRERFLWVDALCINQHDPVEKAVQIPLMSTIYSEAETVIAWPGVDDPETPIYDDALEMCYIISSDPERYARAQWEIIVEMNERYGIVVRELNTTFTARSIEAWLKLLSRKIFQRGWVLQELALAHRPCILIQGDLFDLHHFALAGAISWQHHTCLTPFAHDLKTESILGLSQIHQVTSDLRRVRKGSKHISTLVSTGYGTNSLRSDMVAVLMYMLCSCAARSCTDTRDYIYCVLGLVSALSCCNDSILLPDYSKTAMQVYRDIAELALHTLPHLDILIFAGLHSDSFDISTAPSWVPDFRTTQTASFGAVTTPESWLLPTACTAGFEDAKCASLELHGDELRLSARRCGTVRNEVFCSEQRRKARRCDKLEPLRRLWSQVSALHDRYSGDTDFFETLHRVWWVSHRTERSTFNRRVAARLVVEMMTAIEMSNSGEDDSWIWQQQLDAMHDSLAHLQGRSGIPSTTDMAFLAAYNESCQTTDYGDLIPEQLQAPRRTCLETAQGLLAGVEGKRTVFITDKNSIGMAWSKVELGDELWLLCQTRVPYILRPTGLGTYRIVKDAYVPGAMQGEYIKNGIAGDIQRITII